MLVDFQHHYTPPELMEIGKGDGSLRLDENGNPNYRFNPLLADLSAHVRMMDKAGIDVAVLSCGSGFDQPNLATCRLINDRMHQAERDHPGRFIGLAHVPALNSREASAELRRCAVELGFPGVVIASELQGQALDVDALRPFWKAAADLGLYVFIHPLPRVISWAHMDADDLGRMLGWEFSLMVATVRLINSGLLDELPPLKVQVSHFAGGIARYLPRIRGLQQSGEKWDSDNSEAWPTSAQAVRSLSAESIVLRLCWMVRPRLCRRARRRMGARRPSGTAVLASRVRNRLSSGGT